MSSRQAALRARARDVIRREAALYDGLSRRPRLITERPIAITDNTSAKQPTQACAHGVLFIEPCAKCTRDEQDCLVYKQAAMFRLKALLQGVKS